MPDRPPPTPPFVITDRALRAEYPGLMDAFDVFEDQLRGSGRADNTARIYRAQARALAARVLRDTPPHLALTRRAGPGDTALIWRMFLAHVRHLGDPDVLPPELHAVPCTTPAGDLLDAAGLGASVRNLFRAGVTPDNIHNLTLRDVIGDRTPTGTYTFVAGLDDVVQAALWNIVSWGYPGVEVNWSWPVFPKHPVDPRKRGTRVASLPLPVLWDLAAREGITDAPDALPPAVDLLTLPERAPTRGQMLDALAPKRRASPEEWRRTTICEVIEYETRVRGIEGVNAARLAAQIGPGARDTITALINEHVLVPGRAGHEFVVWLPAYPPKSLTPTAAPPLTLAPLPAEIEPPAPPPPEKKGWAVKVDVSHVREEQYTPKAEPLFEEPQIPTEDAG